MKFTAIFASTLTALVLTSFPSFAGEDLEKEMKVLKKVTKDLSLLAGDFAKGQKLAQEAMEAVKKSTDLVPPMVEQMQDAAAKTAALEDYKKQMGALLDGFSAVEKACAAKDEAKLTAALEALNGMKKKGHQTFTEE